MGADKTNDKNKRIDNASQFPKVFYARHMEAGLAKYETETILVGVDAIKNMMPSFEGKPLYVQHVDEVDLANIKEEAHGYVVDTFYNELDGWVWSKIIAVDDIAINAIASGWSVSNAYVPSEWGAGGTYHNCDYDREILNGVYSHLAIVPNPRYENACVMTSEEYKAYCEDKKLHLNELQNSKKESKVMKLFKREKKEVSVVDGETLIEIKNDDGTTSEVLIQDMIRSIKNAKEEDEKVNMDSMVDVDGDKMTIKELKNKYTSLYSKKNMDDEEKSNMDDDYKEKSNEDDEDEKSNMDDEEKKNGEYSKDEKKNSKDHFSDLKNAKDSSLLTNSTPYLKIDGLATGKAKY